MIINPRENGIRRTWTGPNPDFLIVVCEDGSTYDLVLLGFRVECDSCNVKANDTKAYAIAKKKKYTQVHMKYK